VKMQTQLLLMLSLVFGSFSLNAQPKKVSLANLEDPELYHAFFKAHAVTDSKIQASNAAVAAQLTNATAALYHMTPDEVPKLTAEIRKFNINMGAWYLQQQHYLAQQRAAKKPPDVKILIKNQHTRQRLIMNAHGAIHGTLKHSNWAGLHGYINSEFKTSVEQAKGAGK
jgi:hypothetical protein